MKYIRVSLNQAHRHLTIIDYSTKYPIPNTAHPSRFVPPKTRDESKNSEVVVRATFETDLRLCYVHRYCICLQVVLHTYVKFVFNFRYAMLRMSLYLTTKQPSPIRNVAHGKTILSYCAIAAEAAPSASLRYGRQHIYVSTSSLARTRVHVVAAVTLCMYVVSR